MKIKVTHSFVYDTDNQDFWNEFLEFQDDHPLTLSALEGFVIDRFINPNFDRGGKTRIEILPLTQCARCDSMLEFGNKVVDNYYAYCPQHDEDLDKWECK